MIEWNKSLQDLNPIEKVLRDTNGTPALSIEMETGTGKTYTYIKTMYELHKHYGWTKFIIVVPSVAIREGVVKSLRTMADHFVRGVWRAYAVFCV